MQFVYPNRYHQFWQLVAESVQSTYSHTTEPNSVVIMGTYLTEGVQQYREQYPGCKLIVFQLEPIHNQVGAMWSKEAITQHLHEADEVWDYDLSNIKYLRENLGIEAKFRPFLYSDACTKYVDRNREKDLDVLFFGYDTAYRRSFIGEFNQYADVSFIWMHHTMHPLLDEFVSRAKVIINVHHCENNIHQEQTRLFYLLSNGKQVVSEAARHNVYGDLITEVRTPIEMVSAVRDALFNYSADKELVTQQRFKNHTWADIYNKHCTA
jgi:hypothetical protein